MVVGRVGSRIPATSYLLPLTMNYNVRWEGGVTHNMFSFVKPFLVTSTICNNKLSTNKHIRQKVTCFRYFESDSNVMIWQCMVYVSRSPSLFIVCLVIAVIGLRDSTQTSWNNTRTTASLLSCNTPSVAGTFRHFRWIHLCRFSKGWKYWVGLWM